MNLFGLTGGIASGKSAVGARFRERGVPVVDADQLAREVVAPGSPALAEIAKRFGPQMLLPDGALDRKAVAALVFTDAAKLRELNAITHPRITVLTMQRAQELAAAGHPLACYEAALIVENGVAEAFRPLVVVSAPVELQVKRVVARDKCTEAEAHARIDAQMPLAEKVALADFTIENTGSLEHLKAEADRVLKDICAELKVDAGRYGL